MTNLEHLEKVKKFDCDSDIYHKLGADEFLEYRKVKALEIIAEMSINIDIKLDKVFNLESGCIKIDPNFDV